jgi:hypothetical protein
VRGAGALALAALRALPRVVDHRGRGGIKVGVVLQWVIDTSTILAAAETYLLITRLTGWDLDTYQEWFAATAVCLTQVPQGNP